MKELIKEQWKNFLLVFGYIVVASCVYIILFHNLWGLIYVDILTGVLITASGCGIGYVYIKEEHQKILSDKKESEVVEEKNNDDAKAE